MSLFQEKLENRLFIKNLVAVFSLILLTWVYVSSGVLFFLGETSGVELKFLCQALYMMKAFRNCSAGIASFLSSGLVCTASLISLFFFFC